MRKWFKKQGSCVLAMSLVLAVVFSSLTMGVSAFSFTSGQSVSGIGTIQSSQSYVVTNGLEYSNFTFSDGNGNGQTAYTMEFNAQNDALMPFVYQPKASYGSTVQNSYNQAKAAGYTVYGAVNGEFFSMNSGNYGTLEGRLISNGKIVADSEARKDVCMAIDNEGNMNLVESQMAYHFYINGTEQGDAVIGSINKRYVGTNWWDPLCYFDSNAGGKTYTVSGCPGIEVVFNKTNNTELTVEGTLQGTVAAINTDTYGTSFNDDQFVLFAQTSSANYAYLSKLAVGNTVQIYAEETVAASKDIMKNAVTITSATYPIIVNGQNNTANCPNADDIYATRAQRTAIGVKADGSYVYFCSAGRGTSAANTYGLTLTQVTNIMLSLGCVTAVNFDGGGSSTMIAGDTKVFSAEDRSVGSTILVVGRDAAVQSSTAKQQLNDLVWNAKNTGYPDDQWAGIEPIVVEAEGVLNNAKAMTGDYTRLYMDLQEAMGLVKSIAPKTYISLSASEWSGGSETIQIANSLTGGLELSNTDGKWPSASYSCAMTVPATDCLYYDITVNGFSNIYLKANGTSYSISSLIAPGSVDAGSGDIQGNGKTFKGAVKVSEMGLPSEMFNADGNLALSSITIYAVGTAGNGSKVTVNQFNFASAYSKGDVNGDGKKDSSDARVILRYADGKQTLTADQITAADVNGDGSVNSTDARQVMLYDAGLSAL